MCPAGVQEVHEESLYSVVERMTQCQFCEAVLSCPSAEDSASHVCAEGAGRFFGSGADDSDDVVSDDSVGDVQVSAVAFEGSGVHAGEPYAESSKGEFYGASA